MTRQEARSGRPCAGLADWVAPGASDGATAFQSFSFSHFLTARRRDNFNPLSLHTRNKNRHGCFKPMPTRCYSFTVFFARYRLSSSIVIVGQRVPRHAAISRLAIFLRSVL